MNAHIHAYKQYSPCIHSYIQIYSSIHKQPKIQTSRFCEVRDTSRASICFCVSRQPCISEEQRAKRTLLDVAAVHASNAAAGLVQVTLAHLWMWQDTVTLLHCLQSRSGCRAGGVCGLGGHALGGTPRAWPSPCVCSLRLVGYLPRRAQKPLPCF